MSHHKLLRSSVITSQMRNDHPEFKSGSIVKVHYKIKEGNKERIQVFQGVVIDRHEENSMNATFKVLKVATGNIKTVRTFAVHSPKIEKIEVVKLQRGRRATLRYLLGVKDPIKSLRAKPVSPRVSEVKEAV